MPNFAGLGRSLGDFGNQVGQASEINLDWRQRLQDLTFQAAKQKQDAMNQALQQQELQQRVKQMGQPQAAGIVKGPGGETSGVTFDPATSTYSIKTLLPGAVPEPKFPTLKAAAAYYLQKGDFDKLKTVNDEIDRNKKPAPTGYSDLKEDTQGRLWGLRKDNNKYEIIPTPGAKFRTGAAEKTPTEYDQRITNYLAANKMKDTPENRDLADQALDVRNRMVPKPIPPDIQNLLSSPVPQAPTAEQSRRLADAADRIFGGTAYKQDLMGRGRRTSFPFVGTLGRAPYASVAYDQQEYSDILNSVKSGAARGMDANDPALSGFSEVVK